MLFQLHEGSILLCSEQHPNAICVTQIDDVAKFVKFVIGLCEVDFGQLYDRQELYYPFASTTIYIGYVDISPNFWEYVDEFGIRYLDKKYVDDMNIRIVFESHSDLCDDVSLEEILGSVKNIKSKFKVEFPQNAIIVNPSHAIIDCIYMDIVNKWKLQVHDTQTYFERAKSMLNRFLWWW